MKDKQCKNCKNYYMKGVLDALGTHRPRQLKLVQEIIGGVDINNLALRKIGELVGADHPQKIKNDIRHLVEVGILDIVGGKYMLNKDIKNLLDESVDDLDYFERLERRPIEAGVSRTNRPEEQ